MPSAAAWAEHALWWSERCRSRALRWPSGADWFANDPLGPMPHTHPDASEVVFVASGRLRLTVGTTPLEMGTGDFCLVPPDTYHEPLNVGDTDCCVFVLVCPNWRDRRWKFEGYEDADFAQSAAVVTVSDPGPLPSDDLIESEVLSLDAGAALNFTRHDADHALYVLAGDPTVTVEHLGGSLAVHEFLTVMAGTEHRVVAGAQPARLLSIWAIQPAGS